MLRTWLGGGVRAMNMCHFCPVPRVRFPAVPGGRPGGGRRLAGAAAALSALARSCGWGGWIVNVHWCAAGLFLRVTLVKGASGSVGGRYVAGVFPCRRGKASAGQGRATVVSG